MRVNQYIAHATGVSRRAADDAVAAGRVQIGERTAVLGDHVGPDDSVQVDGKIVALPAYRTIMLNKPVGYVTSRKQQGKAPTIYALLPDELYGLKPIGRLDRDSSGLLLLTNNGDLAQRMQHPSQGKWKRYEVEVDKPLKPADRNQLETGVELDDGISVLRVTPFSKQDRRFEVRLQEGRRGQDGRSARGQEERCCQG